MSVSNFTKLGISAVFAGIVSSHANAIPVTRDFEELPTNSVVGSPVAYDDGATFSSYLGANLYGRDYGDGNISLRVTVASDDLNFGIADGSSFYFQGADAFNDTPNPFIDGLIFADYVQEDGVTGSYTFDLDEVINTPISIEAFENPLTSLSFYSNGVGFGLDNFVYDIINNDGKDDAVSVDGPGGMHYLTGLGVLGIAGLRRFAGPKPA